MALIEFQISATSLLALLRSNAMLRKACVAGPYDVAGRQIVIDRLEFGNNRLRADTPAGGQFFRFENGRFGTDGFTYYGKQVQVEQDVLVHVGDLQAIEAGGAAALAAIPATAIFNLDVQLTSLSMIYLIVFFDRLVVPGGAGLLGLTSDQVRQQLEPIIEQAATSPPIPFDIGRSVLGKSAQIENAALAADPTLSRVALRAEAGTSSFYLVQRWEAFINGAVDDHLQGTDWSLYIDRWLLEQMVSNSLYDGLTKKVSRFHLVTGVGSTYSNQNGTAHITSSFGGNVDAEICHPWFDVSAETVLSVSAPNTLGMDVNTSWHEDPGDRRLCDVEAAVIASGIGSVAAVAIPGAAVFVNGLVGFLIGLAGAEYLQSTLGPGTTAIPDCTQDTETHYVCEKRFGLGAIPGFGSLTFESIRAEESGIALTGSIQATPLTAPVLEAVAEPFVFDDPQISCGELSGNEMRDFLADPGKYVTLSGAINLNDSGSAPLFLCSMPQVLDDRLDVFDVSRLLVVGDQSPIRLEWRIPLPPAAYYSNPYPCRVLVKTTGGVKVAEIPPPPALTQQDIDRLAGRIAQQEGECKELMDSWFNYFRRYNPKWSIDPGPEGRLEHWWQFEVTGIAPGGEVELVDSEGAPIAMAKASQAESLRVQAVTTPGSEEGELGLRRREDGAAAPEEARGIGVVQTELVRLASLDLEGTLRATAAGYVDEAPGLLLVWPDGIDVYDLSDSTRPWLSARAQVEGLLGVTAWPGGAMGWGDRGLTRFVIGAGRCEADAVTESAAVSAAFRWRDLVVAATEYGIELWTGDLRRLNVVECAGTRSAAWANRFVVASGERGLSSFVLDSRDELTEVAASAREDAGELSPVPAMAGQALFVASAKDGAAGGGAVVGFDEQGEPTEVARYERAPWFAGLVRVGGLIARPVEERRRIVVSRLGRTTKR